MVNLEFPVGLAFMFLDGGRKPENPCTHRGNMQTPHRKGLASNPQPSCCEANNCTTVAHTINLKNKTPNAVNTTLYFPLYADTFIFHCRRVITRHCHSFSAKKLLYNVKRKLTSCFTRFFLGCTKALVTVIITKPRGKQQLTGKENQTLVGQLTAKGDFFFVVLSNTGGSSITPDPMK